MCQYPQAHPKFSKIEIIGEFEKTGDTATLMSRLRQLADDNVLKALIPLPSSLSYTAIATADYGRGELLPYSKATVLFLLPTEAKEEKVKQLRDALESVQIQDILVNFSITSIETYLREIPFDLNKTTALLGSRYLFGDKTLFKEFGEKYQSMLDTLTLFHAIQRETRQRHFSYEDTPYALEPNCVEGPGGLRDLQMILRITQAAKLGQNWQTLSAHGFLSEHELRELKHSEKLITTLRAHLQIITRSAQEVLTFELQPLLAKRFGFTHGSAQQISEELMREYYWSTKTITQLSPILMLNIEAALFPKHSQTKRYLNKYFYEQQGMIEVIQDDLYQQHPEAILETFLIYEQTQGTKGLAVRTLRALYKARNKMDAQWRHAQANRQNFIKILQAPQGVTRALRLMNQTGVLGRYLLGFRRIIGTMQHDLFYVYAVDQHTLTLVRNLRRFATLEYTHEFPFCSQLLANFKKPWILLIAALFHDGTNNSSYTQPNFIEAKEFCRHHHLKLEESKLIGWLVENHLAMEELTQNLNLSNDQAILKFAHLVGTERYLTALYLLTMANLKGPNSKSGRQSQGHQLEALYHKTAALLTNPLKTDDAILAQRQEAALSKLCLQGIKCGDHLSLWTQLDIGFFLRHNADQIAWLTYHLWNHVHCPEPIVIARLAANHQGLEVAIYERDRPHLFAQLCGYFTRKRLEIVEACIHTTRHGYALDTFKLVHQTHPVKPVEYPHFLHIIETSLQSQLKHSTDDLSTDIELSATDIDDIPPSPSHLSVKPHIELRPDEQGEFFLLSLSADDRLGLLYKIAKILAQYNISLHTARINTLETQATDVFLLKGQDLKANYKRQTELENAILNALFE